MPRILIADDEPDVVSLIEDVLGDMDLKDFDCAYDGAQAAMLIEKKSFDILISDLKMPKCGGDRLLSIALNKNPYMIVIFISGYGKVRDCAQLLKRGAYDFIQKPFSLTRLQSSINNAIEKYDSYNDIVHTQDMIAMLLKTIEHKDPYIKEHSEQVARISKVLGAKMGLAKRELNMLVLSALLHDLGKMGVHEDILNKTGPLDSCEYDVIKKHPLWSAEIVSEVSELKDICNIVLNHHERIDGKGYPFRLGADEIPVEAKIISVADAYDAMTHDRCYRHGMTKKEASCEIRRCSGTQFDEDIVKCLLELINEHAI